MAEIIDRKTVLAISSNQKIVLVSGSFDILHLGHLRFLEYAKSLVGTDGVLLVILISDADIKERKGENRPVFSLPERAEALRHITEVDYILPWETPWQEQRQFLSELKPAYLAVVAGDPGIDNKREHIETAGGELKVYNKQQDYSTSKILAKLAHEDL